MIKYQFMSIGGNCADIGFLGKDRLRGPVDNMVSKGAACLELVLDGKLTSTIKSELNTVEITDRKPSFKGDSNKAFKFKNFWVVHNDPTTDSYLVELAKREATLQTFIKQVKQDDTCYLVYNLNEFTVNRRTHKLIGNECEKIIQVLKNRQLLNKVIFVSTKVVNNTTKTWNYFSPDFDSLVKKYSLKHIEIIDNDIFNPDECTKQFNTKVTKLLAAKTQKIKPNTKKVIVPKLTPATEIDVVFPYVDCTDPVWQSVHKQYCLDTGRDLKIDPNRFRSWDLLRYLFRSIEKNMPYVRKVHMIVSNIEQVPKWIDQTQVDIVLHKDIIPAKYLPTFSSSCIEMFIGNIKDLAEHFIYMNDDIFYLAPIKQTELFTADGKPIFNLKTAYLSTNRSLFTEFVLQEYRLMAGYFDKLPDNKEEFKRPQHGQIPKLKSCVNAVQTLFAKEIDASISPFRTKKDMTQYLYDYYTDFIGYRSNGNISLVYVGTERKLDQAVNYILNKNVQSICINDADWLHFEKAKAQLTAAFNTTFPAKSKYELDNAIKSVKMQPKATTYYLYF